MKPPGIDKTATRPGNFADPLDWNDVRYAVAFSRSGSLAGAASALGVDQTTVSRRLRALEKSIGTPLFERIGGHLEPTPAGTALLQRGQRIEQEFAALAHLAADSAAQIQGVIRITAVDSIASHYLAGRLAELRSRHPDLAVEIIASSRNLDLSRREADIAVRLARPQAGNFVIRRLARLAYAIYGPVDAASPPDSESHWVAYERSLAYVPEMQWLAAHADGDRIAFRCNNMDALATAVAGGLGYGLLPCLIGRRHPGLRCCSGPEPILIREMWLAIPAELREIPRIKAVADWLVECFARDAALFG